MLIEWRYTYFPQMVKLVSDILYTFSLTPSAKVLPDCEGDSSMLPGVVDQGTEKGINLHKTIFVVLLVVAAKLVVDFN